MAEVFQIFKRERSVAGKALGMRKARRLAIEQNEACGAQIRLKTGSDAPLMLKQKEERDNLSSLSVSITLPPSEPDGHCTYRKPCRHDEAF